MLVAAVGERRLIVAVDGGGSGSRALLFGCDGSVLSLHKGPPLNYAVLGPKAFTANLGLLLRPVSEFSGAIEGYVFSLAGVSAYRGEVEQLLRRELGVERVWLLTDVEAAYMAAARGRDAIVVSAGTGSFAYGRRAGREARVGGWGYLFGDEGSAYWIGREFVRRCLMHYDGRLAEGELSLKLLLEELHAPNVRDTLAKLYREYTSPSRVAELAKVACKAAEMGCPMALDLIGDAARLLEQMVSAVAEQLGFTGEVDVYGTGGVIIGCKPLAEALRREVESKPGRRFHARPAPPLLGCVLHYLHSAKGLGVDELEKVNLEIPTEDY